MIDLKITISLYIESGLAPYILITLTLNTQLQLYNVHILVKQLIVYSQDM